MNIINVAINNSCAWVTEKPVLQVGDVGSAGVKFTANSIWGTGGTAYACFWNEAYKYGKKLPIIGPIEVPFTTVVARIPEEVLTRPGRVYVSFYLKNDDSSMIMHTNTISISLYDSEPLIEMAD